jgi:hypothetical protein
MLGTLGWDGTQKIVKIMALQASYLSLLNYGVFPVSQALRTRTAGNPMIFGISRLL